MLARKMRGDRYYEHCELTIGGFCRRRDMAFAIAPAPLQAPED